MGISITPDNIVLRIRDGKLRAEYGAHQLTEYQCQWGKNDSRPREVSHPISHEHPFQTKQFEETLLRYHPEVAFDRFAEAVDAGKRFMDAVPATMLRDDYHRVILSELGIHNPSRDLLADLNRPLDVPVVEVFPDVPPALAELQARGIRMAIVSDTDGDLAQAFSNLGLRQFFDVFVVSEAIGCCKPDPRMYRAGSDGLGLAPSECLFVDNDPDLVLAAIHLGYQGIAIDRYGSERHPDVKWIENLSDLWPVLGTTAPDQS